MWKTARGKNRLNLRGAFVFLSTIALLAIFGAQWFTKVFNPIEAEELESGSNNLVVQEIITGESCSARSLCSEFIPAKNIDRNIHVPILMYHHIRYIQPRHNARERFYSISPERFEWQMRRLREVGYHPITLDAFWQALKTGPGTLPDRPVLLTFDDGHRGHWEEVYPVLKELDFPATFFIYTEGMVLNGFMNEEMIKELSDDPIMSIASHTISHTALTRFGYTGIQTELEKSKTILEEITGNEINAVSYPYGAMNASVEARVKEAGYDLGFQIGPGTRHSYPGRFRIQRIQVVSWDDPVRLIEKYSQR